MRRREGARAGGGGSGADLDAHVRQALALHQAGRLPEAEALYRRVLSVKPTHAPALHFLGLLLHQRGASSDGLALIERSVAAQPDSPDFLNNLGTVQRDLGNAVKAVASFRKAVSLQPGHLPARDNLSSALIRLGDVGAAEALLGETIRGNPFHMRARIDLAHLLQEEGRADEAISVLREALRIRPNDAALLGHLGVALMEKGDLAGAAETARRALVADRSNPEAWALLSQVRRQEQPDAELDAMREQHARAPAGSLARMQLAFGLGKLHDDMKEYDRAFGYFAEGNAIRRKNIAYDPARTARDFAAMKAAFDAAFFARHRPSAISDDTPVFVVGMPRSGSTLVEQIIASHPQATGGGELEISKMAVARSFPLDMAGGFPAGVANMPDAAFAEAGQAYLSALHARYPGSRRVTDKMLGNFMLIGFLHMMLPKARILHVTRDAAATCLSIWKSHFRGDGHLYGYDLIELADFHNLYTDIMAHWRAVLPGVVHEVRYEDFVADQEGQSRALVDWLGLPWDDRVLAFHEADRPVRTASAAQVRQPMYGGSIDLWKRYGDRLKPLLERLR